MKLFSFISNHIILMKHWIKFQQEWVNNIYKQFKDHDKYIILMYLISKPGRIDSNLFKFYSIDEYYSQKRLVYQILVCWNIREFKNTKRNY